MKCKFTTLSPKVEANYTVANGYEHDAKVIYGDTDSVMVRYHLNIQGVFFNWCPPKSSKCQITK